MKRGGTRRALDSRRDRRVAVGSASWAECSRHLSHLRVEGVILGLEKLGLQDELAVALLQCLERPLPVRVAFRGLAATVARRGVARRGAYDGNAR